jgi:hypothetical protein
VKSYKNLLKREHVFFNANFGISSSSPTIPLLTNIVSKRKWSRGICSKAMKKQKVFKI